MAKTKLKNNKFFSIIYWLFFIISLLFIGLIYYLNVLPIKYILIIIGIILFINLILGIILLNKHVKKKLKIFFTIFTLMIIVGLGIINTYLLNTKDIINNITKKINYKTENYAVIVLKDTNYEELKELENENIGYLDNQTQGSKEALKKLDKQLDAEYDDYDDVGKLSNDLLNDKINAILVEDSFKNIMEEESDKFNDATKILYSFSVKIPEEKESKQVDVTNDSYNIYITGIDTYGKITSVSRSDVNIIATVNPRTGTILLTSIPRDYYVPLNGTNGQKDKLTHAGIYGVEKSVKTIEDLLDIKINYYIKVNFSSVEKLVNTLGSITVHSDYNFVSKDGYKYFKGDNKMNGKQALSFARERHAFTTGDIQRGKNQIYVIQGMADKLMTFSSLTKFNSLLDTLEGTFETNFSSKEISNIAKMQIDQRINWQIESNTLEGTGDKQKTYTYKSSKSYVMQPDMTSVASAKTKISKIANEN